MNGEKKQIRFTMKIQFHSENSKLSSNFLKYTETL